ncbi:dipeptidase, partial [Proteus mirabilis]|nr:dipeptidase [Proteus mirabilis]
EAKYLSMSKKYKAAADYMLYEFNLRVLADAEQLSENLTNQLFTLKTKNILDEIFFANHS